MQDAERRMNMNNTVLITGATSGFGKAGATRFAKEGWQLVLAARRHERLNDLQKKLSGKTPVHIIVLDVRDQRSVTGKLQDLPENFSDIDVLVNNAGLALGLEAAHKSRLSDWNTMVDTNIKGLMYCTRAILPDMVQRNQGHIINISSEAGLEYYQGNGAYGVSKHALNALSEFIQRENQDFGVRVDTICPGMVITEMTQHSKGLDHSKCLYAEDIADLVVWLLTSRQHIKIGTPPLIQPMENPWT